jgi:hypothetical protein
VKRKWFGARAAETWAEPLLTIARTIKVGKERKVVEQRCALWSHFKGEKIHVTDHTISTHRGV